MGTMILFRLKAKPKNSTSTNTYSIKRVWIHVHLPGGVYAICPHPTGILFSAGKEFYLYNLNPINGKLVNTSHKTLDFPITSLHYREDCICVTSHKSSISFFKYNSETRLIEFVKSDFIPRNIHHSLLLNRHLAVGVNQSGGMVALYDDPNDIRQRLQCVFSFHYSDIIVRPKLALLRSQTDLLYDSTSSIMQHILPWSVATSNSTTKNTVKPIVGCTISGGMIHVYRISEMLYSVLSILQDILINYEPAMPLLGSLKNFQWYRALANEGEKSTIHGDLLIEYFCNRLSILEKMEVVQDKTNKNDISPKLKSALISLFSKNQEIRHHSNVVTTNSTDIDFSPGNVVYLLDNILLEFEKYR
ncbi:uncharacterized protein BX663DRAFT_2559 [Cokeromyces recurvatus]|uniref:uncharacterized protein n=1 Tax=Cokeromyces recurvatus TaxID=90255 RepID=UPI00221F4E76|nr:uncharacterized protein BX663DRAFT_2559 [Cokeromyces recurvatus]KAI7907512.1 hypothetical protein BX663DRAFT_2559 [Cokeromyces recurvatus]